MPEVLRSPIPDEDPSRRPQGRERQPSKKASTIQSVQPDEALSVCGASSKCSGPHRSSCARNRSSNAGEIGISLSLSHTHCRAAQQVPSRCRMPGPLHRRSSRSRGLHASERPQARRHTPREETVQVSRAPIMAQDRQGSNTRQDKTGQRKTWHDTTRHDTKGQHNSGQDKTGQGKAKQGRDRQCKARQARQGKTRQGKARKDKPRQEQTR